RSRQACRAIKTLAAQIRVIRAPRTGPDKRPPATGAARCAGDQGVPQVADVRVSRSNPGFEIYAALRWPVAWLVVKAGSGNDLDGQNDGDEPVDGGAERRPPPCPGDVVAALLPEVLEAMACVANDQEPGRSGDACRGQQDKRASDAALHGDHLGSSVGHREPDVDRCDHG